MTTITTRNLTFIDGDRHVIIPAGTECVIYNRALHAAIADEADGLLWRAKEINAKAGKFTHLVMVIGGRPRLLEQSMVETARAEPPKPTPAPKAEAPVKARKQPSLF